MFKFHYFNFVIFFFINIFFCFFKFLFRFFIFYPFYVGFSPPLQFDESHCSGLTRICYFMFFFK
ncbi:MAG: hypothetical protein EHM77_06335 [Planctomycetaceae bacterium]|nr:MAG: hypothetical protein EHM77_06730 [Planctomycetaceae bacterium]RPH78975.1 MAG: hypothetical protein EHM77_06370 [Planctomycetaceae bacterium]RPH79018.1 MAG: hypothetical protein EHM77_06335 [Planctomycetaceae bacterium]